MGIRSKIKKRLPIFGRRFGSSDSKPQSPAQSPVSQAAEPSPKVEEPMSVRGENPVQEFLAEYVKEHKIVLFMKGSPTQPLCGFSANAAGILSSYGKPFAHFDVISDYEVREGVKEFSEWPTLPQIYLGGEFMGGSDILSDMHQNGQLSTEIEGLFKDTAD